MSSVIREDLTKPGTHALVIGVSRYLHFNDGPDPTNDGRAFGMEQLSAAAHSAAEFAAWLLSDYRCRRAPLRSLRVLLSPSNSEVLAPSVSALLKGDFAATLPNVRTAVGEFRNACDTYTENVAIVYVAGHGVQISKHGAMVLLSDVGASEHLNRLEGALDMAGVHAGMNHPATARTQFWFVDSCRQRPAIAKRFETLEGALTLDVRPGDTETSPLFLAATTGATAYARPGGLTVFAEALLWALRGGAAAGPEDDPIDCWHIPVTALIRRLPERVKALAIAAGAEQSVDIAGRVHEAVLHELPAAPKVNIRIDVRPDEARAVSRGTLKQNDDIIVENFFAWPLRQQVDAGLYHLLVSASAPYVNREDLFYAKPPERARDVSVMP